MSALDGVIDELVAAGEDKIPGLLEPLVERVLQGGAAAISSLPLALQPLAQRVVDHVLAHKDVIGEFTKKQVVGLIHQLSIGQGDEAERVYLATSATRAERMKALDEDSAGTRQEATDRSAAWHKFKGFAQDLLVTLGKGAIPLLLAL